MTWKGAGDWLILSQFRHVNFSRTVSITFHWRGSHPRPTCEPVPATAVTIIRRIDHHPFARKVFGKGILFRLIAPELRHCCGFGDGDFRGQFIFRGGRLQILELELHLIDELGRSL
jgi:hypothetical protein